MGGCFGCGNWRSDRVRACVARFLVQHWDLKAGDPPPTPPSPEDLHRLCCRNEDAHRDSVTFDTSQFKTGRVTT
jgi:hypothetical protein